MAQLAEAGGLNPPKYGFESHWGHNHREPVPILPDGEARSTLAIASSGEGPLAIQEAM